MRTRQSERGAQIWCVSRKRWVVLTPEEWVRQHMVVFLSQTLGYPLSLIAVEKELTVLGLKKRFDILCFNRMAKPLLLVECKSADVAITPEVFDQAARYNLALNAPYLCCTNGLQHFYCRITEEGNFEWFEEMPPFESLPESRG